MPVTPSSKTSPALLARQQKGVAAWHAKHDLTTREKACANCGHPGTGHIVAMNGLCVAPDGQGRCTCTNFQPK